MEVKYEIKVHPEDTPVRGNALASGDDAEDRKQEEWILGELARGNEWAWCSVEVVASIEWNGEIFTGQDWLGCCSYQSERDFAVDDGYYPDMKDSAREDLLRSLEAQWQLGQRANAALKALRKVLG